MPDLPDPSNDNEDQSLSGDENALTSSPPSAKVTSKKTTVSIDEDLSDMASHSPLPASSLPRIAAPKLTEKLPKASARKRIEDNEENTSDEDDGYVATALPVSTVSFHVFYSLLLSYYSFCSAQLIFC